MDRYGRYPHDKVCVKFRKVTSLGGTSFATVFVWSPVRDQTGNSSHHRHSLLFGCFCLVFFGAGTFPAVLGVSVLFRTRMRLFEQSVSIVVIWPDQVADTVDPPVVQNDFAAVFACSPVWEQTANSSHHRHRVRFGCFGSVFLELARFLVVFWCSGSVSDTCHCSQKLLPSWLFGSITSPAQ